MGWNLSAFAPLTSAAGAGRVASGQTWRALPLPSQSYVAAVIAGGAFALAGSFPLTFEQPVLFVSLLVFACLTSVWKVTLPIPVANGSTLSVSYAANLMSLLLLGPQPALLIAMAGVLTQCTYRAKHSDPVYRTAFSMAAAGLTMAATGFVYVTLGGVAAPTALSGLARPLVGAVGAYFLVNTWLVAGAIAFSTGRSFVTTWKEDFLWSGASFMVAGTFGALAAVIVARGNHWQAVLLIAPVYLTYRTYQLFVGRLDDQRRHTDEMRRLHRESVAALGQTRAAERALADEKERLAATLAEVTRLEEQRRRALEREQAARATAETANRLKDQFLAVVSHELRTPLNAILGWADMLRRGTLTGELPARAAQTICDSARRQAQLIDDLLDVSRIVSGKLRLNRTHVDVMCVAREAMEVVQPSADGKNIRLSLEPPSSGRVVLADAARLQQVIWNLLANAVKFTPEGGAVHLAVRDVASRSAVEIVVSDDGIGIPTAFLPHVFDAFRQADASVTRVHPGLGLGLSIVKSLVDAHGGTVSAASLGEGLGATFVVRLPAIATAAVAAAQASAAASSDTSAALDGLRILVVDDDAASREILTAHLESSRARVVTAHSAASALAVLAHEPVDVLLADVGMPGEDGYSLMRKVRGLTRADVASVPAAAVTAFARDGDRRRALDAGFHLHLTKPIDADTLVTAVASLRYVHITPTPVKAG
jgi:signal transduction histidine kinase/ActR/RegA family two-component response regulator